MALIWRSATQEATIAVPASISASVTTKRSIGLRPCPPYAVGHVMPIHPPFLELPRESLVVAVDPASSFTGSS